MYVCMYVCVCVCVCMCVVPSPFPFHCIMPQNKPSQPTNPHRGSYTHYVCRIQLIAPNP